MPDVVGSEAPGGELVAFRIGTQEYCVDIMDVREIRGWTAVTALPHAPEYVLGVLNLRGAVLPIVDLGRRLGFGEARPTARHVIIVTQVGTRQVGLLVDAVSDILNTEDGAVHPTPNVASDHVQFFVRGLLPMDKRMISLISLEHVLPNTVAEAA